jgi:two-component system, cell cycle sensor histidine kinase and response regulator CckA
MTGLAGAIHPPVLDDVTLLVSLALLALSVAFVATRERDRRRDAEAEMDWVRSVVRATNSSIWERDLETGAVTIVAAGPGVLLGRSEEAWRDEQDRLARVHPDDLHVATTWVDRLRANGDHCEWEVRVQSVDGSWHVLRNAAALISDDQGRPARARGLSIDITEQRLHESGFTALFESTLLGVAMVGADGRIVTCNESFSTILGRPRSATVGSLLTDVAGNGGGEGERCFLRADGTPAWARLTIAQIEGVEGMQLAILEDTSPRKQAELEREQATMRLQRLFDVTRIGMAVLGDGCIPLDVNDAYAAILERPIRELTSTPFTAHTHPDDLPIETALVADVQAGARDHFELEKRLLRPDGETVPVRLWVSAVRRSDGSVENVIAMLEDLSDRKRAEAELSEKTALLERSQEVARIGSFTVDPVTGRAAWSLGIAEMFEVNDAAFGRKFEAAWRFVHVDDRDSVRRAYLGALAGDDAFSVQFRLVRLDGSHMWVVANGVVHRDDTGAPERVVGVILDVTERRELEEKLRQAEKLEAVGRLAGGVAHDFNNLLTIIVGHAESALATGLDAQPAANVHEILGASSRASELIRALLDFSRARKTAPPVVDLNDVVASVARMLPRLLEEHIVLSVEPSPEPAPVVADRSRLEQMLVNLALNARDAMPGGGTLAVRTAAHGRNVKLTVSDTGEGMDERTRSRIFEPFFTTKEQGRGTGLGLASVYGLVKQTGGSIAVDSKPGAGTTFSIELPLAAAAPPAPVPIEHGLQRAHRAGERVLVVEDDAAVRSVTVGALERAGYAVTAAEDGASALQVIESEGDAFAAIVTDLMMPRMSGSQLVAELERRGGSAAVVFTSGYPEPVDGPIAARVSFLDKPFTPRDLIAAVQTAIDATRSDEGPRALEARR